jgi:hypothetical protein
MFDVGISLSIHASLGSRLFFDAKIEDARQCLDQLGDALIIQPKTQLEPCELGFEVIVDTQTKYLRCSAS